MRIGIPLPITALDLLPHPLQHPLLPLPLQTALPHYDHLPSLFLQKPHVLAVALPVGFDLGFPKVGIGFRYGVVLAAFMSVPEATIDKDYGFVAPEHQIGLAG